MKKNLVAIITLVLAMPLMLMSGSASAHHRYCHYGWGCRGGMPLVYHVVRELRDDPTTYDQAIYVSAEGHKVILSGGVGNVAQRQVAVNIARYTCGVRLVVDNLHVIQPSY